MVFVRATVFACALGASLVLAGCKNSGQEEGRKAIRENTVNAFPLKDTPTDPSLAGQAKEGN